MAAPADENEFEFKIARFGTPSVKTDAKLIKLAEDVAASMTKAAPDGWAVSFNNLDHEFKITYAGGAVDSVDTITVGDFNNPKEFFAQFLTPDEADAETRKLRELREEICKTAPEQTERIKILDELIAQVKRDKFLAEMDDEFKRNPLF